MPLQRKPQRLYQIVLESLAAYVGQAYRNLSWVYDEDQLQQSIDSLCQYIEDIPKYASNDYMKLLLEYYERSYRTWTLDPKQVGATMHPGCTSIRLWHCSEDLMITVLSSSSWMSKLENLTICSWISNDGDEDDQIVQLLLKADLPNLVHLHLVGLATSSTFLPRLQSTCPKLQQLIIWPNEDFNNEFYFALVAWKNLTHLDLRGGSLNESHFTVNHAMFILNNLRCLEVFYCLQVGMAELVLCLEQNNVTRRFLLKDCNNVVNNNSSEILEKLYWYFPNLETVHVRSWSTKSLAPLAKLAKLKQIEFCIIKPLSKTIFDLFNLCSERLEHLDLYYADWLPILKNPPLPSKTGMFTEDFHMLFPNLLDLSIEGCDHIDISVIAALCTNLDSLSLINSHIIDQHARLQSPGTSLGFQSLIKLYVSNCKISERNVAYMLQSCFDIQNISLTNCLEDSSWHEIISRNPMNRLTKLSITSNHITQAILPSILKSFPLLKSISLRGRNWQSGLTSEEKDHIRKQIALFDIEFLSMI